MLTEYALLKLQSSNGEEQFIHTVPALLCSKRVRPSQLEVLPLTNIMDTPPYHALIYYKNGSYHIAALSPLLVNGNALTPSDSLIKSLNSDKTQVETLEKCVKGLEG